MSSGEPVNLVFEQLWHSEEDTAATGQALASLLQPGDVIALVGDLGAGKTRFVQAVAKGLDVPDEMVHSPTFTLIHEYRGRHPLRHCDAYRLKNSDEFTDLGLDELFGEDGVAFVEWADRVAEFIPRDHLRIELTVAGISTRQARFIATGQRSAEIVRRLSLL
ncbi:MAG TPA: tRNA (adenosine(37)-N6)-threonylcarbamoyltransferase complex ATPase subunit type 1 TsaE [Planctomycetaceae bacterium]|nr:tRNA (adenosine(37)-N6)-threonylcarbamoyltransferase complex ATPase subunit type 1 TsaE [Planctomycetaceae bacterium]